MTVLSTTNRVTYTGNGVLLVYPYTFKIFVNSDLAVYVGGVLKTLGADYSVSGAGTASGDVTFTVAPAAGASIVLLRDVPATQKSAYPTNDNFPAVVHEDALDKLTMLVQQAEEALGRAPKLAASSALSDIDFPSPGASQYIRWNAAGTALEVATPPTGVGSPLSALTGFAFANLPTNYPAGTLAYTTDEDGVYFWNGTAWKPVGELAGRELRVVGNPTVNNLTPGAVGIGSTAPAGVGVNMDLDVYSTGTVNGMLLTPKLRPDADNSTPASGDAHALRIKPTVHISPNSTGPVGSNAHKHVVALQLHIPDLVLDGAGTGKPQDLCALHILNNTAGDVGTAKALRGLWGIRIQGGLPNEFVGCIHLKNEGAAIQNIGGADSGEAWNANALRIENRIAPVVIAGRNSLGEGFALYSAITIDTYSSGVHANLGNALVKTPVLGTAGGATCTNFTTLKVEAAPAALGSAVLRALWVGTGNSQFDGNICLAGVTASFPALKRSGTSLHVRLADDSTFAPAAALAFWPQLNAPAYGASVPISAGSGEMFVITATDGVAFTVANPTGALGSGQFITIRIKNTSGGALGALTWGTNYRVGAAWTQPADGFSRAITFCVQSGLFVEVSRSSADVAN